MQTVVYRNISAAIFLKAISLAPIYDCGSCLFPQADEEIMRKTLDDPAELEIRIFERPLSGIKTNGKKIQYFKFISSLENKDCSKALKKILQKQFYKTMLRERKERILDFSYRKLCKLERSQKIPYPQLFWPLYRDFVSVMKEKEMENTLYDGMDDA